MTEKEAKAFLEITSILIDAGFTNKQAVERARSAVTKKRYPSKETPNQNEKIEEALALASGRSDSGWIRMTDVRNSMGESPDRPSQAAIGHYITKKYNPHKKRYAGMRFFKLR